MKRIVLVRPQGPRNVGSILRVVDNFGPAELVIVKPDKPSLLVHPDFEQMSHGVERIVEKIRVVDDLPSALSDCTGSYGFTARARDHRALRDWRDVTDELVRRTFLIAYNINLNTTDVAIAKSIAEQVRERDGGLPGVQAMGFFLDDRNQAQVSMNLLDFNETSIKDAYEEVHAKAMVAGVEIDESEIVGLVPADALDEETAEYVQLKNFDPQVQVVEERLKAAGVI